MPRLLRACIAFVCLASAALASAATADHYELALRPDFATKVLEGHARIRLIAHGPPEQWLALASPNLQLARATLDGRARLFEKTSTGWRIELDDVPDTESTHWLDIDYRAPAAEGLVFGERTVYTAFHTCQWMPCVGPDLSRATVDIALDLPAGYRSVASGRQSGGPFDRPQRWREVRPYPLYTFGFAAGSFSEATDPADSRLRFLGSTQSSAALQAKFQESARVLAFLEDKAGMPLPGSGYTQVLVAGNVAQEVSSFSVIGEGMLDDPQDDWVIVHEMAHQWWGNLVTCESWDDFWLNEGVVVFMTAAWKEQRAGDAAYRREIDAARARWQRATDAGFDKPLNWSGEYPDLRTRRDIQYGKAAVFLHTLRQALGERAFWDGLRRYTRENASRAVRTRDFESAMEAAAGRSLRALFEPWTI